jgi:hypothetical protein
VPPQAELLPVGHRPNGKVHSLGPTYGRRKNGNGHAARTRETLPSKQNGNGNGNGDGERTKV